MISAARAVVARKDMGVTVERVEKKTRATE